ncbi:hypothetical protein M405DRAFT_866981 [Rhizopogon salebrosus TDB-379]|nr:hypothetical protein M405DRAFT_866981 [Rhizopogon salebrosus TDB-379]
MQPSILRRLSRMFAQPFIGLSTLEISQLTVFGFRRDPGEPITFDFRKSPLRDLSLSLQGLSAKGIFLPCDHMARFYLDLDPPDDSTSSLSELLNALHRCHSLKECILFLHAGRELTPLPQVRLEHLQCLGIQIQQTSGDSNQLDNLLNVIRFPSLSSLDIAYCTSSASPIAFPEQLNPFLRRHASNLRRFIFSASSPAFNAHDFLRIIEVISSITKLDVDLHYTHSIVPLAEALTPVLHDGCFSCLLPRLEALDLTWEKRTTLPYIAKMAEMRCGLAGLDGIAQLKCITCMQIQGTDPPRWFDRYLASERSALLCRISRTRSDCHVFRL